MTQLETPAADKARRRLLLSVEHLIEHGKDHAEELSAARGAIAGHVEATRLLDRALLDLGTAHQTLTSFLECLEAGG